MRVQAGDVAHVVREAQRRYADRKSVVVAHSSGAHSSAISLANGSTRVDAAVLQAGVCDPLAHYCHEGTRGVETVSPMAPAGDADEDVLRLQDYPIPKFFSRKEPQARSNRKHDQELPGNLSQLPLEGDREACHVLLLNAARCALISWGASCGSFVIAAAEEDVVPLSSSLRFLKSLRQNGVSNAKFLLYTPTQLVDFAFDWIKEGAVNEGTLDIRKIKRDDGRHLLFHTGMSRRI